MKIFKSIIYLCLLPSILFCQHSKSFDATKVAAVMVSNISGDIEVTSNNSNQVLIEYEISNRGSKSYQAHFEMLNDSLYVVVEHDNLYDPGSWDFDKSFPGNLRPKNCNYNEEPIHIDFKISMPSNKILKVSTINDGDINISKMDNEIYAYNINGSIAIKGAREVRRVHTINGEVDVDFVSNPKKAGKFYTLNGDLNVNLMKGLDAQFAFNSFNGDFYTNIENLIILPAKIKTVSDKKKFKIKIGEEKFIQVGDGDVALSFETFNGDAIVKINK